MWCYSTQKKTNATATAYCACEGGILRWCEEGKEEGVGGKKENTEIRRERKRERRQGRKKEKEDSLSFQVGDATRVIFFALCSNG